MMDRSAAAAYVYAKASGMLAKSYVGPRAARLFEANSLHELWALLCTQDAPVLPEALFAQALEQEAEKQFASDYITLLKAYSKPGGVLVSLLRSFDYDNLKDMGATLCAGAENRPALVDIRPYSQLNYDAWPNLATITKDSPAAWYNTVPQPGNQHGLDEKLDKQYTRDLWDSVLSLKGAEREALYELIRQHLSAENMLWVIRLKVYFAMPREEIIPRLAYGTDTDKGSDPLAGEAFGILDLPVDSYDAWAKWKYAGLLNPSEEGVPWTIDPRWLYQAFRRRIQHMARQRFHQHPFTDAALASWFLIKQFELDCIRTAVEGLRLNVDKKLARETAGV
ncbi:MAG: V-type ATPase subunit [Treponema sp.]|jgi:vacuolar-type H+-ATPase subunit C/Vma6|nr:V-type ATPase subunit [Treponema sp.]